MAEDYVALYRSLLAKQGAKGTNGKRLPRGRGAEPEARITLTRED